jgi:hypothetical protein
MFYSPLGSRDLLLELERLRQWTQQPTVPLLTLPALHAEPLRPVEGLLAHADGADWDPGAGGGLYMYRSGSWVLIG